MTPDDARRLAATGRLYPALILHGGTAVVRRAFAEELSRTLLCAAEPAARPCGVCRHCRRIVVDPDGGDAFHPDFRALARDLKTSTSVEATRELLRLTQQTPFEARGQVLVVVEAESLSPEAANSLLKVLEEPPTSAPRHFLLLAPAREDLLPTLRSRSWSVYLGAAEPLAGDDLADVATRFGRAVASWSESRSAIYLLVAAAVLEESADFEDLRAERPWARAAAAVLAAAREAPGEERPRLLALAEDLLGGARFRLRRVPPARILEGLVARHLGGRLPASPGPF